MVELPEWFINTVINVISTYYVINNIVTRIDYVTRSSMLFVPAYEQ